MIGAQPAQTFSAKRTVLFCQRLVGRGALDLGQSRRRDELVLLDRGDGRGVRRVLGRRRGPQLGRIDLVVTGPASPTRPLFGLGFRSQDIGPVEGKEHQSQNHQGHCDKERRFRFASHNELPSRSLTS